MLPLLLVLASAVPAQAQEAATVVVSLGALLLVGAIGFVCCCCGPVGAYLVCCGGLKHVDYSPDAHFDVVGDKDETR